MNQLLTFSLLGILCSSLIAAEPLDDKAQIQKLLRATWERPN